MEPVIAIVTGSRDWKDEGPIDRALCELHGGSFVIHGFAPGADKTAWRLCRKFGHHALSMPADWDRFGNGAGPIRNREMRDAARALADATGWAVICLAFPLPQSKGTLDMIKLCEAEGWEVRR